MSNLLISFCRRDLRSRLSLVPRRTTGLHGALAVAHAVAMPRTHAGWLLATSGAFASATRALLKIFGAPSEQPSQPPSAHSERVPGQFQFDASVGGACGRWSDTRFFTVGPALACPAFLR